MTDTNSKHLIKNIVLGILSVLLLIFFIIAKKHLLLTYAIMILTDLNYYTLPITMPLFLLCFAYTHISRNFKRFNLAYAILILLISVGLLNAYMEYCIRNYFGIARIFFLIQSVAVLCIVNFLNWKVYKQNDTKKYLPFLLLFVIGLVMGYSWIMKASTLGFP